MSPLLIKAKESWDGTEIYNEINALKQKLGKVIYAVCDNAGNLKNALSQAHILIKSKLGFIKEYESLIMEMYEIGQVIKNLQKEVKTKGLNQRTIKTCKGLLKSLESKNGKKLRKEMNGYFKACSSVFDKERNLICTSDIIESMFGKYKNLSSDNKMAGITSLALCIASITVRNIQSALKKALESIKVKDIVNWTKENLGQSVFSKRKEAFKNC